MLYFYILSLNIYYKDQLRDLIIERWSNKLTLTPLFYNQIT